MNGEERKNCAGDDEDVQRKEAGESLRSHNGAAKHQAHEAFTDKGNPAQDGCTDAKSPVSILIPAQYLASKRHAQSA